MEQLLVKLSLEEIDDLIAFLDISDNNNLSKIKQKLIEQLPKD